MDGIGRKLENFIHTAETVRFEIASSFWIFIKESNKKMNTCCTIRREWERGRGSGGENGSGSGSGRSEHREHKKIRRNYEKEHPTGGALISSGIERNILNQSKAYSVVEKY